jgi:hypothetical protein
MRDNSREDLKKLFSIILDSEVTVKENINIDDKEIFLILIKQLESTIEKEDTFSEAGLDITSLTDPLWFVVENCLILLYGREATDLIVWYLYERKDMETQEIYPYEDPERKEYTFQTIEELWEYFKYKFL